MDIEIKAETVIIPDNFFLHNISSDYLKGTEYVLEDIKGELIPRDQIEYRVKEIARKIEQFYSPDTTHLLWVREGARPFYESLSSHLSKNYDASAIKVESMRGIESVP